MSNIKVNDLQPLELEIAELSNFELVAISGGKKWWKKVIPYIPTIVKVIGAFA
ncbi:MAG: hypothetical protein NT917_21545 [Microcystis aeruginosa WS75]|nr:hypothetical protein [Microcystis aeruginosa WS75]MCU7245635.1 hypothetical protein [Microcystis aeruginosa WS75]